MTSDHTDPFEKYAAFAHLRADNAPIYRAILSVFSDARTRFEIHLRPADIRRGLKQPDDDAPEISNDQLSDCLAQLKNWKNLDSTRDMAEATSVEEFYRVRFLYQLTAEGEAAESALRHFHEILGRPGELQTRALRELTGFLERIAELIAESPLDVGKLHAEFRTVFDRFEELTTRAQSFMRGIQSTIDLHELTPEQFIDYKDLLIDYLERFLGEMVSGTSEIVDRLEKLPADTVTPILELVAEHALIDAVEKDESRLAKERESWLGRWSGFRHWFLGSADGGVSQAEILRRKAREAIPALLYTLGTINDRRVSKSDRMADWKTLALWFAEAPDEAAAHRLWRGAFALAPARHLQINDETLTSRDQSDESPRTSWLEAEPVWVSPKFRKSGRTSRGGPKAIDDLSKEKEMLARRAADEAAEIEAARKFLARDEKMRLSEFTEMPEPTFALFLDLLGEALASRTTAEEIGEATSTDGSLVVRLEPIPMDVDSDAEAKIQTSTGMLRGPDAWITITDVYENF